MICYYILFTYLFLCYYRPQSLHMKLEAENDKPSNKLMLKKVQEFKSFVIKGGYFSPCLSPKFHYSLLQVEMERRGWEERS